MVGQQKGGNTWEAEEPDVVNQGPANPLDNDGRVGVGGESGQESVDPSAPTQSDGPEDR